MQNIEMALPGIVLITSTIIADFLKTVILDVK
jgi:hypothetical protein